MRSDYVNWIFFWLLNPIDDLLGRRTLHPGALWALLDRTAVRSFILILVSARLLVHVAVDDHFGRHFEPFDHLFRHRRDELVARLTVQDSRIRVRRLGNGSQNSRHVVTGDPLLPSCILKESLELLGTVNKLMLFNRVEATFQDVTRERLFVLEVEKVEPVVWVLLGLAKTLEHARNIQRLLC